MKEQAVMKIGRKEARGKRLVRDEAPFGEGHRGNNPLACRRGVGTTVGQEVRVFVPVQASMTRDPNEVKTFQDPFADETPFQEPDRINQGAVGDGRIPPCRHPMEYPLSVRTCRR